jgi:hypothetical protein
VAIHLSQEWRTRLNNWWNLYEQHRHFINENFGLVIALFAAVAAFWTGYEARHARLEATEIGKQSLEKQQASVDAQKKSVDAQIQAMQLDERPFIRVDAAEIKEGTQPSLIDRTHIDTFNTAMKYSVSGKTPAINIRFFFGYDDGYLPEVEIHKRLQIVRQNEGYTESLLYPDNFVSSDLTYPRKPEGITVYGFVVYNDLFHVSHRTEFCYNAYNFPKASKGTHFPVPCTNFIPEIN